MMMRVKQDLRKALGRARDQGARPTCMAFAVTGAHEANRRSAELFSVEHLFYYGVQRSHKDPNRGLTPNSVSETLFHNGQPAELAWPYQAVLQAGARWDPPHIEAPIFYGRVKFSTQTVADVGTFLIKSQLPLVLVLDLSTSFYRPDKEARVFNAPNDTYTARHAVLAVGCGEDDAGSYVLVRNSWGELWGDGGHAWLHEDYLRGRILTVGELVEATLGPEAKR